jgi:hypothetical protein
LFKQGCLAAILASCYDYEETDDGQGADDQNRYYLDRAEQSFEDGDQPQPLQPLTRNLNSDSSCSTDLRSRSSSFECADMDECNDSATDISDSSPPRATAPSSIPQRNFPRQQQQQQQTSGSIMWGTSAKEKARISQIRHRRRRYDGMCKLLITSSELLLLEKSVARGFLPMLGRVLVPEPKKVQPKTKKPPLWNNRKSYNRSKSAPTSPADKNDLSLPGNNSSFMEGESSGDIEISSVPISVGEVDDREYLPRELDKDDVLRPFLESLTPGAGVRCISLFLVQYLLTSEVGYDARIRHVIKKLGVIVLVHDMERDPVEHIVVSQRSKRDPQTYKALVARASRKYEALEHSIARRLIRLSESDSNTKSKNNSQSAADDAERKQDGMITRQQLIRGVKIGSAGVVAGTIFALTGGLAAPGIAAGFAALAGSAAATAAVSTLTSAAVVTTIFGVGGGTLAAYKMQRRTEGLTQFEFHKETTTHTGDRKGEGNDVKSRIEAELFSTICISGWLRDTYDYQRPWGLHPTNPRLLDRLELLERFYSIHSPDHVPKCTKILASWKGEEKKLWAILRQKYGRDPDHVFPLDHGPRLVGGLTLEQDEVLDQLFVELGYNSAAPNRPSPSEKQSTPFEKMRAGWKDRRQHKQPRKESAKEAEREAARNYDSVHGPVPFGFDKQLMLTDNATNATGFESGTSGMSFEDSKDEETYKPPAHLSTVWDYKTTYGGEIYTVKWESHLLKTICDCVMDLAMDVVSGATRQILKQTILSTLLSAIVWPSYLVNVANMIDGDWTLAVERADEAGKVMARTLLFSRAGHRPVTLVGFSFGGRIVYSCLKELARFQEEWEEYQELKLEQAQGGKEGTRRLAKLDEKFEGMREPASIIEDAVIMGVPNHLNLLSWKACRQIVAGRLVNCYSRKDLILSLMFQAKRLSGNFNTAGGGSLLKPVCGTCPVLVPGVENIDVSDLVSGHQDYCLVTGKILERVRHGQPLRSASNDVEVDDEKMPEAAKKLEY